MSANNGHGVVVNDYIKSIDFIHNMGYLPGALILKGER